MMASKTKPVLNRSPMARSKQLDKAQYEALAAFRYALRKFLRFSESAAQAAGIRIESCAEDGDLARHGIAPGKCIDDDLIRRCFGLTVPSRKDPGQRPGCRCVPSKDIGCYGTCGHGCAYCYAT